MRKKIKAAYGIAGAGLGLSALSSAGTAMGSNLVGNFTNGLGSTMGATGSIIGAGMTIDATKMLYGKKKKRY